MRTATDQLRDIRGGMMVEELTEQLAQVVNAVIATGKKGVVNLKLEIAPASKGDAVVTITDDIKTTIPREKKAGTLMFALPSGSLQRQDPRQVELQLKVAEERKPALQGFPAENTTLHAVGGH